MKLFTLLGLGAVLCGFTASFLNAQPASVSVAAAPDFAGSLALRTDRIVADSTRPRYAWLTQTSPVAYTSKGALRLKVVLAPWEGDAKPVKELGTVTIYGGNLATTPVPFAIDVTSVPDGFYRYVAEVFDGDTKVATLEKHVVLAAGMEEKQANVMQRLAKISGHESAKASVLYPFDLARVINLGKRVYGSGNNAPDFGLNEAGVQTLYDFTTGMKKSAELLAALEAGKEPVLRAGGDTVRHYYMKEADEILPYRVYVPSTWDGKSALPLVFVLHGNSRDHDFYHDREGGAIRKAAEKHGFMLVATLGYWPNGGYNYAGFASERGQRGVAAAMASPQQYGAPPAPAPVPAATATATTAAAAPAAGGGRAGRGGRGGRGGGSGGVNGSTIPALVRAEWSEQDTMHVFNLIKAEYPIDPKRTFLYGYSAGGNGGHYIAQEYAENWSAVALGGANARIGPGYKVDRIRSIPMYLYSGADDPGPASATTALAAALKEQGANVTVTIFPGIDHNEGPVACVGDVFDFFAANGRK